MSFSKHLDQAISETQQETSTTISARILRNVHCSWRKTFDQNSINLTKVWTTTSSQRNEYKNALPVNAGGRETKIDNFHERFEVKS